MDRVKVAAGSVQNLEMVFDDLQTLVNGNLKKRIDALTGSGTFGVINALENGVQVASDLSLKIAVTDVNSLGISMQPGVGLLSDGGILLAEAGLTTTLDAIYSGTIAANTYYQISLKYLEVGTDPVIAQNAFYFDKAGLTPYAERFSRWSDSYELVAYLRTESVDITNGADEIPLAIVKTGTVPTKIVDGPYTYQDIDELRSATDNAIDIRKDHTYRLDHNVLNDALLVFKDRDSIGTNKINGAVEVVGLTTTTLDANGVSNLFTTNISGLLTVVNTTSSYAKIKSGDTYTAGILFEDTAGSRGYVSFDYNHKFLIGFANTLSVEGDGPSTPPATPTFVMTSDGYLGNYFSPTVELDLKNTAINSDETSIKLSHVPSVASSSTIFKFGVGSTGGIEYGRGYFQPITYDRPLEFLNLAGNYVFKLDNANRKAYAYSLEVEGTIDLSAVTATLITADTLTTTLANVTTANVTFMTLSGLAVSSNDVSNIDLPGTSSTEFRVGVGSNEYPLGRPVLLQDPDVNIPNNFRIYDVSPTDDRRESHSYIHLKWNWDGLNGIKQNDDEVLLNIYTTTGELLNLTSGAATIRQFYFSSSGNLYEISSYNASTRVVTLASNYTGADIISDTYPAKIIDPNVSFYTVRAIELHQDIIGLSKRASTTLLDYDNIALDPEHVMKLELNKRWSISIKAGNRAYSSPYVTMIPGTYDPDHFAGGQGIKGYSSPHHNVLPFIDGATGLSTPSMTLTSTAFGFKIDIEGWESDSRDTSPHEFEIGYTTLSGITWENSAFSTTKKSGATFVRTVNRTLQVSTNKSTTWTVGVRPIQNNQPVGIPILSIVLSGGGGIVPSDSIVVGPMGFSVLVAGGVLYSGLTADNYTISGTYNELWGENTLAGSTITVGSEESSILANTLRFEES